jgi:ribonuclease-3|tara:strand:+ start:330 stop:992 length:663 start_codon:yes stop_codon:yes gene_type:complete
MSLDYKKLEKIIDVYFKDKNLLIKSFTHKSYDSIDNNEKLEFLGDRVLGLVISKKLLEIYPDEKEGILDKKFASLVNRNKCLEIAKSIDLENFILIIGNKKKIKIENKIISDCCEALIGAIYLDQGIKSVEKFILKLWDKDLKASSVTYVDSKTKLQEYSLKKYKTLPIYKLIENIGPRHKPIFKVGVRLENSKFINGTGNSKKDAEQKAAALFLKNIKI